MDLLIHTMLNLGFCEGGQHVLYMQIDFLQANISQLESQAISLWADVVVMNPPFGTRRKGADLEFLRAAFQVQLCGRSLLFTGSNVQSSDVRAAPKYSLPVLAQCLCLQ